MFCVFFCLAINDAFLSASPPPSGFVVVVVRVWICGEKKTALIFVSSSWGLRKGVLFAPTMRAYVFCVSAPNAGCNTFTTRFCDIEPAFRRGKCVLGEVIIDL